MFYVKTYHNLLRWHVWKGEVPLLSRWHDSVLNSWQWNDTLFDPVENKNTQCSNAAQKWSEDSKCRLPSVSDLVLMSWSCPTLSWSPNHQITRSTSINPRSVLKLEIWGRLPSLEDDGRRLSLPWVSPDLPWSSPAVSWHWEASKLDFPGLAQNGGSACSSSSCCCSSCDFVIYRAALWAAKNYLLRNSFHEKNQAIFCISLICM